MEKTDYTYIIIIAVVLFIVGILTAYAYDCTNHFTNWEPFVEKINPVNVFGLQKYVYSDYVPPEIDLPQPAQCVCSFDIDYTLTCGDPKHAIEMCKQNGCKLSLNTARPTNWISDISLEKLGFTEPHYDPRDHYFNPKSYTQTAKQVGQVKSNYLQLLKDKYNVPDKKCVILFDDAVHNLSVAQENGFSTIRATETSGNCGIHPEKSMELGAILNKC